MINSLIEKATSGDVEAQVKVGLAYYHGKDVVQDYKEAVRWLGKADLNGSEDACCWLGICHYKGQGVQEDHSKAFEYFKKGAAHGKVEAQYYLGLLYLRGIGTTQDRDRAVYWLEKSANSGHKPAVAQLEKIESESDVTGDVLDSFDNLLPEIDSSPLTRLIDSIFNLIDFTNRKKSLQTFIRYQDILARFGNASLIVFAALGFALFLLYGIKVNEGRWIIVGSFFGIWVLVLHYLSAKISLENRYMMIREKIYLPSEAIIRSLSIFMLFLSGTVFLMGVGRFIALFNDYLLQSLLALGGFTFCSVYLLHAVFVFANAKTLLNVEIQKENLSYAGSTFTALCKLFLRGVLFHNIAGFGYLMMGALYTLAISGTFLTIKGEWYLFGVLVKTVLMAHNQADWFGVIVVAITFGLTPIGFYFTYLLSTFYINENLFLVAISQNYAGWFGGVFTAVLFAFSPMGFYFTYHISNFLLDIVDSIFGIAKDIRYLRNQNEEK